MQRNAFSSSHTCTLHAGLSQFGPPGSIQYTPDGLERTCGIEGLPCCPDFDDIGTECSLPKQLALPGNRGVCMPPDRPGPTVPAKYADAKSVCTACGGANYTCWCAFGSWLLVLGACGLCIACATSTRLADVMFTKYCTWPCESLRLCTPLRMLHQCAQCMCAACAAERVLALSLLTSCVCVHCSPGTEPGTRGTCSNGAFNAPALSVCLAGTGDEPPKCQPCGLENQPCCEGACTAL
jgi:hypothetical protein